MIGSKPEQIVWKYSLLESRKRNFEHVKHIRFGFSVPEKSSNGTSVEELKQRLGTLYGQSYTPKYVPSSNSGGSSESRATATGPQSYGGVAPAVNGQQSFVKSSPFLSSSSTFYATASSANSSKNASTGSSWGLSQQPKPHFPNSSSSFGTYSAHATASNAASTTTKFADPFAAFNRPFEENSGSSVDGLFATSETTTNHTQQNFRLELNIHYRRPL